METVETNVFEELGQHYEPVATGRRFVNYLVDTILFYVVFLAIAFLCGVIAELTARASGEFAASLETGGGKVLMYLAAYVIMLIFYTLIEGASKGRSLGKLITGTVAIREDGNQITWKDALMRSLCRLIPFEPFSGLSGRPWHDTMTSTLVIRK